MQPPTAMLTAELKAQAAAMGFNRVGVIPAAPARRLDAYLAWIDAGLHGEMGYMARPDRVARRRDPAVILPGVRSLVVVGLDYAAPPLPAEIAARLADDPSRGRFSNYAWGADYHDVMTPRLEALGDWLRGQTAGEVASRAYVDTGALLERDHGETAGLGFTGKNTLLIDPRAGSWFFLGVLLTTLPLDYDQPLVASPSCGRCRRCLDACPTAAFPAPYVLDARRCISYLTIELKGWIPAELRPLMGNWVYGCDVCQAVCPFNRFAAPAAEAAFRPASWDAVAPPLLDLLALDDEGFRRRFAHGPVGRIGRARLVRNACVAAGNWGSAAAVAALAALLTDAAPIVRGHAAWALGRIGGQAAGAALAAALPAEADPDVRHALSAATQPRRETRGY
ncbi:MAG TPA: tRNA epoxyqueuosine(34) reductase QueG [Promineifilum sp.]|nr:tRNA epoxyqueuosine(34) reductase QueG [Promineifilum sp.]